MISAIHLIWIVPLSAMVGYVVGAFMQTASKSDEQRGGL